jgi:hypothetical protein
MKRGAEWRHDRDTAVPRRTGQTQGYLAFADERAAGHVVHAPDLYDDKPFTDLNQGVGYAREVGFGTIGERGRRPGVTPRLDLTGQDA